MLQYRNPPPMHKPLPPMSEVEVKNFEKVFSVAKRTIKFKKHWESLGYEYPKKSFLSYFFKVKENPNLLKNRILKEYLFDAIISAGIDVLDISYDRIYEHYSSFVIANDVIFNKFSIKFDDDFELWLSYFSTAHCYPLKNRLKDENLADYDVNELNGVLNLIYLSYAIIFMDIFGRYNCDIRYRKSSISAEEKLLYKNSNIDESVKSYASMLKEK